MRRATSVPGLLETRVKGPKAQFDSLAAKRSAGPRQQPVASRLAARSEVRRGWANAQLAASCRPRAPLGTRLLAQGTFSTRPQLLEECAGAEAGVQGSFEWSAEIGLPLTPVTTTASTKTCKPTGSATAACGNGCNRWGECRSDGSEA